MVASIEGVVVNTGVALLSDDPNVRAVCSRYWYGVSPASDEATMGPCAMCVGRRGWDWSVDADGLDSSMPGKATGGGHLSVVAGGWVEATDSSVFAGLAH